VFFQRRRQVKQQELQRRVKQRRDRDLTRARDEEQRDEEQRDERAVTFSFIQTDADLFAAFHM